MSIATHNGETFSAGDEIIISDNGGTYRATLEPPSSGSDGSPITYTFDAGAVMRGSDVISGWTVYDGSIYQATVTDTVYDLFYDGTQGTKRTSIVACVAEGDWYYTGTTLYMYAPGDPDTEYDSPGVEAVIRDWNIRCFKKYIELYGNGCDVGQAHNRIIFFNGPNGDRCLGIVVDNFYVHDSRYGQNLSGSVGISLVDCQDSTIRRCHVERVAWNGVQFTVWAYGEAAFTGNVVEQCHVHHTEHNGIDLHMINGRSPASGWIVRHNLVHNMALEGIYWYNEGAAAGYELSNWVCHNNICHSNGRNGISADRTGIGVNHDGAKIYGNTCFGNGTVDAGAGIYARVTDTEVKNNICFENNVDGDSTFEIQTHADGGTANIIDYNCIHHSSRTNIFRLDGLGYTAETYYASTGQQEHGVHEDPQMTDPDNGDFTLKSTSPCIGAGANLGAAYDDAVMPGSTWPTGVTTGDQDDY